MGNSNRLTWYYKALAKSPCLVFLGILLLGLVCTITPFICIKLPDFTDPTLGFEARGTVIGQRLTAWTNLQEENAGTTGMVISNPNDIMRPSIETRFRKNRRRNETRRKQNKKKELKTEKKLRRIKMNQIHFNKELGGNETDFWHNCSTNWDYGTNQSFFDDEKIKKTTDARDKWVELLKSKPPKQTLPIIDGVFCGSPRHEYAHFAINPKDDNKNHSLFDLDSIKALCDLEQSVLTAVNGYNKLCERKLSSKNCCKPWSLPNYIAALAKKGNCSDIEEKDILLVKDLLLKCYPFYENMKLLDDCSESRCKVNQECSQYNAIYNILHYLTDTNFINLNDSSIFLKTTMIFLPIARGTKSLPYFHELEKTPLSNSKVKVAGIDMGLKNALFDECLLADGWRICLGGLFIITCTWLYTSSLFVTITTFLAIFFSLGIAYFIYTVVFQLEFFPFMNLLGLVVVVGIGADDVFIYMKIWKCVINSQVKTNTGIQTDIMVNAVTNTLSHAAISMFVTSVTTAAAFFTSYSNSITAVRCFGIFAGTAVITNYGIMVTWLPSAVVVHEKYRLSKCQSGTRVKKINLYCKFITSILKKGENNIKYAITRMPGVFVISLGLIGIGSGIVVFYKPKLQLPDSPDFKLFVDDHPFEVYDSKYRNNFWFEKTKTSTESFKLPLRFVWGIEAVDTGNYLNPSSRGNLILDPSFNISAPESQVWLLHFCQTIKEQSFASISFGLLLPNCFLENFITWMSRRCIDDMSGLNRTPCCEEATFPYSPDVFEYCLPQSISSLYETPREFFVPGVAGPKFSRHAAVVENDTVISNVLAIVIEYESSQLFSLSFKELDTFVSNADDWFQRQLLSAPQGLRNGWFTSDLYFYDLQKTLSSGILFAIGMPMIVALIVLLLTTLNVLISIFAILTVTLTILTTVAILVGLGWQLNVLESVAVTTAIGLAVDFSLHYGVHYRLSPQSNRQSSVMFSLSRMVEPTLMAMITTMMAGAFMIPSKVLAYVQIGVFLVVIMLISWLYATFFLLSLLQIFGPEHGFLQFNFSRWDRRTKNTTTNQFDQHKSQSIVSEHLISASDMVTSESHELDSLTSSSVVKPLEKYLFSGCSNKQTKYSLPKENSPSIGSIVTVLQEDAYFMDEQRLD